MKPFRPRLPFARIAVEELERRDTPTFNPAAPFFNGFGDPAVFAVGDFNADGNADLAVAVSPVDPTVTGAVQILLGTGAGDFTTGPSLPLPGPGMDPRAISTFRSTATNHVSLAVATVSLPAPTWLEAESSPWTCTRDKNPRVLDSTERCVDCPRWRPRDAA